jgi:hypothetical protein
MRGHADGDAGDADERHAVHVEVGAREMRLEEHEVAFPREMRIGDEQAAARSRAISAERPCVRRGGDVAPVGEGTDLRARRGGRDLRLEKA